MSQHITETYNLVLNNAAKNIGGDKYSYNAEIDPSKPAKTGFIYVPQKYSRPTLVASLTLTLTVSTCSTLTEKELIPFKLVKQGKSGDDRYTSENEELWKGDVYLNHKFRNSAIFLIIT